MWKNKHKGNVQPIVQTFPKDTSMVSSRREVSIASYQWPIPPASEMVRYEECCPWAATRILTMAEEQWEHRRILEKESVSAWIKINKTWQIFAFIIAISMIVWSFILIFLWKSLQWFSTLWVSIIWGLGIYIYGKNKQEPKNKQETKEKE